MMAFDAFDNLMIDRLPMALCGITHVISTVTLEVCPKLNIKE